VQSEVFDFLLAVHAHLAGAPVRYAAPETAMDLQAVERALPDCDWFDVAQTRDPQNPGPRVLGWETAGAAHLDSEGAPTI